MAVKGSLYARDYFMSACHIGHIRAQKVDIKFKRGVRDVDSVLAGCANQSYHSYDCLGCTIDVEIVCLDTHRFLH
jgi:hypothetical protein